MRPSSPAAVTPLPAAAPRAEPGQVVGGSFRDPGGFLFWRDGELYRQVNRCYAADYELLMDSGLYEELVGEGLLVPHEEVDAPACSAAEGPAADENSAYKVIRPRRLGFTSYPYEWCFSHLKEAALATLRIQRRALARGMWLKDASAYNVQLDLASGRQVLIDTLSLERYPEGKPWAAYRQFCQHFLAPLALMAHRDARLGQLLRVHLDGIPLDFAARLLPWRTRLSPGWMLHLHLHARAERRQARRDPKVSRELSVATTHSRRFSRRAMDLLLDSLERTIRSLEYRPGTSAWGDYYAGMHNYSPESLAAKERIVGQMLDEARADAVWDLGANDGRFSRLAARRGATVISFDADLSCVQRNFQQMRTQQETGLLPLVLDLTNPSAAIGWNHQERMSLAQRGPADVVLALGLIHHLAIGNNVPWDRLAAFFARLGRQLIVEFIPRTDSQVRLMLAGREDIFAQYEAAAFERAFRRHFEFAAATPIPGSLRTIYHMRRLEA